MCDTSLMNPEQLRRHVETNLSDEALEELIRDADAAIVGMCGPHAINGTVEETVCGGSAKLFPAQPIRTIEQLTEVTGSVSISLSSGDYRSWHGGRMLERLQGGAHPRIRWGDRVHLTYQPVDDDHQRKMAIVRLVQLGIQYSGVQSERLGPFSTQYLDYTRERDAILKQLCPTAVV